MSVFKQHTVSQATETQGKTELSVKLFHQKRQRAAHRAHLAGCHINISACSVCMFRDKAVVPATSISYVNIIVLSLFKDTKHRMGYWKKLPFEALNGISSY